LPIQSWKLIVPWVVSAVKFGASSLMRSDMIDLPSNLEIALERAVPKRSRVRLLKY
jgi:hypothetical protein